MAHTSARRDAGDADPFGLHAPGYARAWDQDPVAAAFRAEVHRVLERWLPPGGRVLDAGCGPGTDALWLAGRGHRVVAIDRSPGMVAQARARGVDARVLPVQRAAEVGPVDAALLDFGVLDCGPLEPVAEALAAAVRPGGVAVLVPMPRLHPTWMLAHLALGEVRAALRRLAPVVDVPVEGAPVRTRYWSGGDVRRAFAAAFELVEQRGLGFLLPPPGGRRGAALDPLERPLRGLPVLRALGDHLVLVLRRRDAPAASPGPAPQRVWHRPTLARRLETARARHTGEVRRLRVLVLHLTEGCNSRCVACDFRGPAGGEALTAPIAGRLAAEARAAGATEALLTGGEPLLRPDLPALLAAVRLAGLRPTLLTNGLLLRRHAAVVARWCDEVVVSLDGHDAATWRAARGVDGLEPLRAGLRALWGIAPGLRVRARVTVTTANAGHLLDIGQLAVQLGLHGVSYLAADLAAGEAFGRSAAVEADLVPDPDALRAELHTLRRALPPGFLTDSPAALDRIWQKYAADRGLRPHRAPACDAPWTSVVVQPDLSLRPCFFLAAQHPQAHARDGLRAGLYAMGGQLARLRVERQAECARCVCWARLG